jgi:septation ring formation regulator EzrA
MNYQLAGANEDAVRRFRKRLDALEAQLVQLRRMRDADAGQLAPIEETMQRTLDALDAEIREAL